MTEQAKNIINIIVKDNKLNTNDLNIMLYLFGLSPSPDNILKENIDKVYDLIMSYRESLHTKLYLKVLKNAIELKQLVS